MSNGYAPPALTFANCARLSSEPDRILPDIAMSFISELHRRNVIRIAIGYLAGAWLLIQILETLFPIFGLAETSIRVVVVLLAIAFIPMLVLAWVFEWTPEGLRRDQGKPVNAPVAASRQRFDRIVIVVLVAAVAYFAVDKFVLEPERRAKIAREAQEEGRVHAILEQYQDKSIVVLPFANLSPDPDQEYFADGLSEELLNLLARMPALRVISRSTAFTFKGKEIVVPEVAKKLKVSHVLEGSVRKAGDRIRVTAQLIEANTDTHLWSQTYDRNVGDAIAIQDEISAQVVSQLKIHLVGPTPMATAIDPEPYELYLQANHIIESWPNGDLNLAEAKLEQVLEAEPAFLPALHSLGEAYTRVDSPEDLPRVRELAARMAQVAPASSYANTWLGWIAIDFDQDYQKAAKHLERAIADDPFTPDSLLRLTARLLAILGQYDDAIGLARYEVSRNPACLICTSILSKTLRWAGRHHEAAQELEGILDWQQPTENIYWGIGVSWLVAGEPERALDYFDRITKFNPAFSDFARLFALYDLGRHAEFEVEFEASKLSLANTHEHESLARIYAWTGQNEKALSELERMVEENGPGRARLARTDLYTKLQADPRFQAFLQRNDASDANLSSIDFKPPFPPALRAAIKHYSKAPEPGL